MLRDTRYLRRGSALLWSAEALGRIAGPQEAVSVRQLFQLAQCWPAELPSSEGSVLVVAGLDGCLDCLTPEDAASWLDEDVRRRLLSFQDEYAGEAGIVFWVPDGRRRIRQNPATGEYLWRCAPPHGQTELHLGRLLWGGAHGDARRIVIGAGDRSDPDGADWAGLHHPRIS
jgi:hypothetical protein